MQFASRESFLGIAAEINQYIDYQYLNLIDVSTVFNRLF